MIDKNVSIQDIKTLLRSKSFKQAYLKAKLTTHLAATPPVKADAFFSTVNTSKELSLDAKGF